MALSRSRLFLGWLIVSTVLFVLMLGHTSVPATIFGRFSPSYVALLAVMLATMVVASAGFWLAKLERLPVLSFRLPTSRALAWVIMVVGSIIIALLWLFLPGNPTTPAFAIFRIYIITLVTAGMLLLLHISDTFDLALEQRWMVLIPAAAVLLMVALTAIYLGRTRPSTSVDEPFLINWAWTWFQNGEPALSMFPSRPREFQAFGMALIPVMGAWLDAFGLNLKSARLFLLVVGWLGAPFIYLTARRLYGQVAAIAALVFAIIIPLEHSEVRPDIWVATALSIALYTFFRAREKQSLALHFVTGFVIGLAIEGNPYSVRYGVAFGLLYVFDYLNRIREARRWVGNPAFWMFAAGGLAFGVVYFMLHVVLWARVDLLSALSILSQSYTLETELAASPDYWTRTTTSTLAWFVNYPALHPFETLLALAGIGSAVLRRRESDRYLLFILLVSTVVLCLLFAHYHRFYWIHHLPIIVLLGGALIADMSRRLGESRLNFAALSMIGCGVALLVANIHYIATRVPSADRYIHISQEIDQLIPPDLTWVTGDQIFYYGLTDRNYVSIGDLETRPADTWVTELGVEPPQAVILLLGAFGEFPAMKQYIAASDLQLAACFEVDSSSSERVSLYLPGEDLPPGAPRTCD